MKEHKHCKNCGMIVLLSSEDKYLLDKEVFARDVAYSNCFCEQCIDEYGLDYLCKFYKIAGIE